MKKKKRREKERIEEKEEKEEEEEEKREAVPATHHHHHFRRRWPTTRTRFRITVSLVDIFRFLAIYFLFFDSQFPINTRNA